jgi:hypothetical protein
MEEISTERTQEIWSPHNSRLTAGLLHAQTGVNCLSHPGRDLRGPGWNILGPRVGSRIHVSSHLFRLSDRRHLLGPYPGNRAGRKHQSSKRFCASDCKLRWNCRPAVTGFIVQTTVVFTGAFLLAGGVAVVGALLVAIFVKQTAPIETGAQA